MQTICLPSHDVGLVFDGGVLVRDTLKVGRHNRQFAILVLLEQRTVRFLVAFIWFEDRIQSLNFKPFSDSKLELPCWFCGANAFKCTNFLKENFFRKLFRLERPG